MHSRIAAYRRSWFLDGKTARADFMAGLLVALALIPEAIGFSLIAGVDPRVGLYASVTIAMVIALIGGRPGMISAATAAVAVLVVPLVRDHGVEYLFAATILMGIIQGLASLARVHLLMHYVSRSVIAGFVNALAVLIFMAQLPQLIGVSWQSYAMIAAGIAIIYGLPRFTKAIPSPLVAILLLTAVSIAMGLPVNMVSDTGKLPEGLPIFAWPDVPLTMETLKIILPYSAAMAAVGLLESLLTAQIVDDMTDSVSNKQQETAGQGGANIIAALFGGMGGCAMIGQSIINVRAGGRTRLSTFMAGSILLFLLAVLGPLVGRVPMPALVAVMIVVSIGTVNWQSLRDIRRNPPSSSAVMLVTMAVVLATKDLSLGVLSGVLLSGIFFAAKVRHMVDISARLSADGQSITYSISGQIFFASADRLIKAFRGISGPQHVIIDATHAHFWDITAVAALDAVTARLRGDGHIVDVVGFNPASADLVNRFTQNAIPQKG